MGDERSSPGQRMPKPNELVGGVRLNPASPSEAAVVGGWPASTARRVVRDAPAGPHRGYAGRLAEGMVIAGAVGFLGALLMGDHPSVQGYLIFFVIAILAAMLARLQSGKR